MNRSPWRLTRIPRARRWGGPRGERAFEGVEPGCHPAGTDAHADPTAVVGRGADAPCGVGDVRQWTMLGDHRLILDEPAGSQDHAATGPDGARPVVGPHAQADDVPAVDDQCLDAGIGRHSSSAGRHGSTETFHEEAAGGVDALRLMTARCRDRYLVEWVGVLAAAEEQPGVVGRFPVRLVAERRPERHADRDQPVKVVGRTLAIDVHSIVVHAGPEGGPEERRHVLRRVPEAAGSLQRRAAPR